MVIHNDDDDDADDDDDDHDHDNGVYNDDHDVHDGRLLGMSAKRPELILHW